MADRAHVRVFRGRRDSLRGRTQSVPIDLSSGLPPVVRVSRHYRHQLEGINGVPRRVISLPNSIHSLDQNTIDANDSAHSISIIVLDSYVTNRFKQTSKTVLPSIDIERNALSQLIETWPEQKVSTDQFQQKNRNKKQRFFEHYCTCSLLCKYLLLIGFIFLGVIIASIVIALLSLEDITTTTTSITQTTTTTTTESTSTTTSVSTTITTVTTTSTAIPCISSCNSEQTCIEGICVNVGYLACTLTWSRPGDGDIVVTTPNNQTISYKNRGPSSSTDGGQLDRDDQNSTGPENVYWTSNSTAPPLGIYYVCFEPYSINPTISIIDPITVIYRIVGPSGIIVILTRTFTSVLKNSYHCDATSTTLVGSFTYP